MEKKEDRRIAMTKRLLKAALIELLKEQDIYHISIRELCERADVNRTTFYKYYGSQFDLLTDMEKDMLDFIAKAIERHETEPTFGAFRMVCVWLNKEEREPPDLFAAFLCRVLYSRF